MDYKFIEDKFKIALEIPPWSRLTTGCNVIDSIIRGGIPVNGITEIVGPSGVGKTQFCLQLTLTCQLPIHAGGLNKGAVYICTEDIFPSKRLYQLVNTFPTLLGNFDKINFMDNIFLEHISDYVQFQKCLSRKLPILLHRYNIGLIVIDSIAGMFRSESACTNYQKRSTEFQILVSQLNRLGTKHNIAVVCTNQIADNITTGKSEPCLGLTWSNLVTSRFYMSRHTDGIRLFEIVFAPDLPNVSCKFIIKECGLAGI